MLRVVVSLILFSFGILLGAGRSAGAQLAPEPHRPLVFVPGILGSELVDENNQLVWGGLQSFRRFQDLEIGEQGPVKRLRVGGPIRNISILGPFWTVHQYDNLLEFLKGLNFKEGENLFIFPYDWRLSNFETAEKLKAFIDSKPQLANRQFDILAHSMGGIVTRIYLQTLGGGPKVARFFSLGVPARGSMNSFATMSGGWGEFQNFMAGGIGAIRRVVFSFPSLYELLPSYEKCCRFGNEDNYSTFDPTDAKVWIDNDWIPAEHRGPRFALIEKAMS